MEPGVHHDEVGAELAQELGVEVVTLDLVGIARGIDPLEARDQ